MTPKQYDKFLRFVFCTSKPYEKCDIAVNDADLLAFAQKVIDAEDAFNREHPCASKEDKEQHLREMLELVRSELPETSKLVRDIKAEFTEYKSSTGYYDDLIRIRAVFGLNEIEG